MQPVVTVAEMAAIDAEATEPVETLIDRAGRAVARAALDELGGAYGRRVIVVAGPGNNGADGRVAARHLRRRGVRCAVVDALDAPAELPPADLVIDAAFGTGLSRPYTPPDVGATPVLAVDIPSGLHGDHGTTLGDPLVATTTVTFAAAKPGLLLGDGPEHCGRVRVADIGLDVGRATIHLVDDADLDRIPARPRHAHKWSASVLVVGGSPGMTGAPAMVAAAAQRSGAGMVRVAVPAVEAPPLPTEAVARTVSEDRWALDLLAEPREDVVVLGPGLGLGMPDRHQARELAAAERRPVIVDGDALTALGDDAASVLAGRLGPTILTPHDAEFERLTGHRPGDDRIADAVALAAATRSVVVLKGPTTIVADTHGAVRLVTTGDQRLATAGTGDVLCGVIAALVARGLDAFDASSLGSHVHGLAGAALPATGGVASDVVAALPAVFAGHASSAGIT